MIVQWKVHAKMCIASLHAHFSAKKYVLMSGCISLASYALYMILVVNLSYIL